MVLIKIHFSLFLLWDTILLPQFVFSPTHL